MLTKREKQRKRELVHVLRHMWTNGWARARRADYDLLEVELDTLREKEHKPDWHTARRQVAQMEIVR